MKEIKFFLLLFILTLFTAFFAGCKKEDQKIKGCTNPVSINYNKDAVDDDGSCIMPYEKVVGDWNVVETEKVTGAENTFMVKLTQKTDSTVTYTATRTSHPPYFVNNLELKVLWNEKKLDGPGVVGGTIISDNELEIKYFFGLGSTVYEVTQHLTR